MVEVQLPRLRDWYRDAPRAHQLVPAAASLLQRRREQGPRPMLSCSRVRFFQIHFLIHGCEPLLVSNGCESQLDCILAKFQLGATFVKLFQEGASDNASCSVSRQPSRSCHTLVSGLLDLVLDRVFASRDAVHPSAS